MKNKKGFRASIEAAGKFVIISVDQARSLPNIAGKIIPASLSYCGWYGANVAGVNTLFVTPKYKHLIPSTDSNSQ